MPALLQEATAPADVNLQRALDERQIRGADHEHQQLRKLHLPQLRHLPLRVSGKARLTVTLSASEGLS